MKKMNASICNVSETTLYARERVEVACCDYDNCRQLIPFINTVICRRYAIDCWQGVSVTSKVKQGDAVKCPGISTM